MLTIEGDSQSTQKPHVEVFLTPRARHTIPFHQMYQSTMTPTRHGTPHVFLYVFFPSGELSEA